MHKENVKHAISYIYIRQVIVMCGVFLLFCVSCAADSPWKCTTLTLSTSKSAFSFVVFNKYKNKSCNCTDTQHRLSQSALIMSSSLSVFVFFL